MRAITDSQLLSPLLDLISESIVWVNPVHSTDGTIEDFEVAFANRAADEAAMHPAGPLKGLRLLRDGIPSAQGAQSNFESNLRVFQTGKVACYSFMVHHSGRFMEVVRRPYAGGVLSIAQDRRSELKAQEQEQHTRRMLDSIVDAAPVGIIVYKALRGEDGSIRDFSVAHHNRQSVALTGIKDEQRMGQNLQEVLHRLGSEDLFRSYVEVVEQEASFHLEAFLETSGKWVSSSAVKLDDGFVVMLTDITDIKLSQEAQRAQSGYLNKILDNMLTTTVTMEAVRNNQGTVIDFRYRHVNRRFLAMVGKSADQVIGASMLTLYPSTSNSGIFDIYTRVVETGTPAQSELHYAGDGLNVWFEFSVVQLDPDTVLGTFYDISPRKAAFEEIERQKTLLDNILKYSSNGISVTEVIRNDDGQFVDGRTILANDAAADHIGISKGELLTKSSREIDPDVLESPLYQMALKTLHTGEPFHTQYYLQSSARWLELHVSRMDEDHLINVFQDISAIKEAQLQVENAAARLDAVFQAAQSGMFIFAPVWDSRGEVIDFRFVITNPSFAAYVGQTPAMLNGALGSEYFPGYLHNGVFDMYKDTFLTGQTHRKHVHYNVDGHDLFLDLQSTRLHDEVLVTFTDHTPLKKVQQKLEESVLELQGLNANLEQFAYAASHDLKEPIRKITFFSDRLREKLNDRLSIEEQRDMARVQNAAGRMSLLVDELLEYAHITKGLDRREEIDLNKMVQVVLDDLELTIKEKGAHIHVDSLPHFNGNRRQIQQAFQNLISNALKYSKAGEPPLIQIQCREVQGKDLGMVVREEDHHQAFYLIEVSDNGIGFKQGDAERIFNVFTRLHGMGEYAGSGVGLSIVRKVVDNHKGYIWAESEPAMGSAFKMLLPV